MVERVEGEAVGLLVQSLQMYSCGVSSKAFLACDQLDVGRRPNHATSIG